MRTARRVAFALVVILALSVLLSGCKPKITSGVVVDKTFKPARTVTQMSPLIIPTGKSIRTIMIPRTVRYSEAYTITIETRDSESGETERATYKVQKSVYDSLKIGDFFSVDGKEQ